MANEFVTRTGLIVSGSTYLPAATSASKGYILSFDTSTKEVYYMSTSSVTVTVPGSDTQVIYNNGGSFGASSNFVFSGSNVGIGTTTPGEKIYVSGTNVGVAIDGATSSRTYYNRAGAYIWSTGLRSGDTKFHIYDERSIDRFVIDDSGNVGIGTTSPSEILDVQKAGTVAVRVYNTSSTADAYFNAKNSTGEAFFGINATGQYLYTSNNIPTLFYNSGSERMRITNAGNVGIGITSPEAKLDVSGSIKILYPTGKLYAAATPSFYGEITPFNASGQMIFNVNYPEGNIIFQSGSVEVARFKNTNLGIGTDSPSYKLDVQGSAGNIARITDGTSHFLFYAGSGLNEIATTGPFLFTVSGSERMRITTAGNVGIGTTSPTAKLFVSGSTNTIALIKQGATSLSNDTYTLEVDNLSHSSNMSAAGAFRVSTNGNTGAFVINGIGNVSIGTNIPQNNLHISGAANGTDGGNIRIDSTTEYGGLVINENTTFRTILGYGNAGNIFSNAQSDSTALRAANYLHLGASSAATLTINGSDNVGIGTTSPNAKLDVNGNVIVTGSLTVSGSSTFTNIGPAVFTGSITQNASTASFGGVVGIGTTTPDYRLEVKSGASNSFFTSFTPSAGSGFIRMYQDSNNHLAIYGANASGTTNIVLNTSGVSYLKGGNVIVGGSADNGATFQVQGNVTATSFTGSFSGSISAPGSTTQIVYNSGGALAADSGLVYSGSRVGIGTTTPVSSLQVNRSSQTYNSPTASGALVVSNLAGGAAVLDIGMDATNLAYLQSRYIDNSAVYQLLLNPAGGNIGIGTTTPSTALTVAGAISSSGATYVGGNLSVGTTYNGFAANISGTTYVIGASVWVNDSYGYANASSGGTGFFPSSSTAISINSGGNTRMFIASGSGNVGIGTTTPDTPLVVQGGATGTGGWNRTATLSATYPGLIFNSNGTKWGGMAYDYSAAMRFWVNATNNDIFAGTLALSILNNGNIGIGNSDPGDKLVVDGTNIFTRVSNTSTGDGGIKISYGNSNTHGLHLLYNPGSAIAYIDNTYPTSSGQVYGDIQFRQNISGSMTPRMVIKAENGNVGIGTTTPTYNLEVSGSGYISGSLTIAGTITAQKLNVQQITSSVVYSSGSNIFGNSLANTQTFTGSIQATGSSHYFLGNVGIGTTSPSNKLDVTVDLDGAQRVAIFKNTYSTGYTSIAIDRPNTARYSFLEHSTAGTTDWYVGTAYNGGGGNSAYQIGTGINTSDSKLFITTAGNIGIGTTSPSSLLNVVATGSAPAALTVQDGARKVKIGRDQIEATDLSDVASTMYLQPNSNLVINGTAGNTGIGTQPSYKLHVDANTDSLIKVSNGTETYIKSTYFGYSSTYDAIQIGDVYGKGNNGVSVALGIDPSIIAGGAFSGYEIALPDLTEFITANGPSGSATDWNQAVLVITGSRIGIGTGTPTQTLEVGGNILASKLGVGGAINTSYDLYNNGTTYLNGETTVDDNLYISGNVGIGTTSPSNKLDVLGSATIRNSSGGGALNIGTNSGRTEYQYVTLGGGTGGTDYGWQVGRSPQTGGVINDGFYIYDIKTNNTPFVIALGGNVGIGTTSPGAKLQIAGGTLDGASLTDLGISSGLTTGRLGTFDASSLASISTRGDASSVELAAGSSATYYTGISATANNATSFTGTLRFFTSGSEKVRITPAGKVGIGTTTPNSLLYVYNDIAWSAANLNEVTSSAMAFKVRSRNSVNSEIVMGAMGDDDAGLQAINNSTSAALKFVINPFGGNVGVGTSSPSYKLDVTGDINFSSTLKFGGVTVLSNSSDDVYGNIRVIRNRSTSLNDGMYVNYDSTGGSSAHLRFFANGTTERMRIDASSGNVGIGTSSPSQKLDVSGSINVRTAAPTVFFDRNGSYTWRITNGDGSTFPVSTLNIANNASTAIATFLDNGNVGIGTTSPSSKLEVYTATGDTKLTVTTTGGNSYVPRLSLDKRGDSAWNISSPAGGFNFAIDQDGSTRLWIASNTGNVGIGTTTPGNKLEVNGGLTATSLAYNYTTFNGQAGGSAGWIDFGRLSLPQNGYNASISFYAGSGYNANNDQNAYATLFIRTSNGSSTDANGFYFSAFATRYGRNSGFLSDIRIKPTGSNEYQIYGYTGQYSGVGYYKVEGAGTTFTSVNTASSDPGSGSTAYVVPFEYRVQDTLNVTGSNVGIGTTSPSNKLYVSNTVTDYVSVIENLGTGADKNGLWVKSDSSWTSAVLLKLTGGTNDATILQVNPATVRIGLGTLSANDTALHVSGAITIEAQSTQTQFATTFSGSLTTNTNIASVPTASFKAAFFDYYVASGSVNMRAGTVMTVHNNSTSRYTDTSTADIGTTAAVDFSTSIVAGSLVLTANISSGTWEVKTAYRAL